MDIPGKLRLYNQHLLPENFVGLATMVRDNTPKHAAILIRYKNVDYLYHYPGSSKPELISEFTDMGEIYLYKVLEEFNNQENDIGVVLWWCSKVCQNSNISYGYIVDGSNYNESGGYETSSGLPEIGTCVGFCICTLNQLLVEAEGNFIEYNDWDDSGIDLRIDNFSYSNILRKYPDLNLDLYHRYKKRVSPLEYLCCAFIKKYPIRKEQVDKIISEVQINIELKLCSA